MASVTIKNLDIIFGQNDLDRTLEMLDQGKTRQEISNETGDIVGVHNASLEVKEGEICVLMGLSGSGKSSLLRAINGLNTTTRGELVVEYDGEQTDIATCDRDTLRTIRANCVSMVFQKFALMPWLTVVENVAFGLEMKGIAKGIRISKAMEQLEMVGLAEWSEKYPHELSGGMQQRVGLARAFSMDADVLLMDEPFSALDPLIRNQLQDELLELQTRLKKTIIFVSHDLDEALKLGTNIAIMESARIIQQGKPEDIVLRPSTEYVREFVAHTNPLNVLCGESLMTPAKELAVNDDRYYLDQEKISWVTVSLKGEVMSAGSQHAGDIHLLKWNQEVDIEALSVESLVVASPSITMREALEIRYRTGRPIVIEENGRICGVLSDKDFYHALLGKHFSQVSEG